MTDIPSVVPRLAITGPLRAACSPELLDESDPNDSVADLLSDWPWGAKSVPSGTTMVVTVVAVSDSLVVRGEMT